MGYDIHGWPSGQIFVCDFSSQFRFLIFVDVSHGISPTNHLFLVTAFEALNLAESFRWTFGELSVENTHVFMLCIGLTSWEIPTRRSFFGGSMLRSSHVSFEYTGSLKVALLWSLCPFDLVTFIGDVDVGPQSLLSLILNTPKRSQE